jgi:hypothetical protein
MAVASTRMNKTKREMRITGNVSNFLGGTKISQASVFLPDSFLQGLFCKSIMQNGG